MSVIPKTIFIVAFFFLATITFAQIERWVYRYSDTGDDVAYCLVYGADGNLYAGGYTWSDSINQGITVISLDNAGNERWVYRHPDGQEGRSICYGEDGNIYVAGGSYSSPRKFMVISLTPAGNERWVYQYPAAAVNEICYGSDGNIYAVGTTQSKILVVSLDSNGNERWTYIYSTPASESNPGQSITFGLDGNIYVAGYAGQVESTDVAVISLTPSGSERWVYLYNGPYNYYDFGNCIIYGPDSNLYVFGVTCYLENPGYTYWDGLVICLDNSGNERWTYISGESLTWFTKGIYSGDGNLYIAGDFGWDIPFLLVASISNSGTYRWHYIDTTWGYARSLVYGEDGNIYVAGLSSDYYLPDTTGRFTVLNFAPDGSIIWVYRYPKPNDEAYLYGAYSVIYGTDGNIYAAGATQDSLTGEDFTVISLSRTGIQEDNPTKVDITLKVLPNVIRNNAKFQYIISEREHINLALYNILGRKVATIAEGIFEPGLYTCNFYSSNLPSGIYFLILEGKKKKESQKMLVVR